MNVQESTNTFRVQVSQVHRMTTEGQVELGVVMLQQTFQSDSVTPVDIGWH